MAFLIPRVLTATIAETDTPVPLGEETISMYGVSLIAEKEPGVPNDAEIMVQVADEAGNFADALPLYPSDEYAWESDGPIKASFIRIRGTAGDAVRALYKNF